MSTNTLPSASHFNSAKRLARKYTRNFVIERPRLTRRIPLTNLLLKRASILFVFLLLTLFDIPLFADQDADGIPDEVEAGAFGFSAVSVTESLTGKLIAVGDVNGDGFPDVVSDAGVLINKAQGKNFQFQLFDFCLSCKFFSSNAGELADLDGDGDLDLFAITANDDDGSPNRVLFNDGTGTFSDSGQELGNDYSVDVALADIDGDGDKDAFVANDFFDDDQIWINDGTGFFSPGQSIQDNDGNVRRGSVDASDIDGDGDIDFAVAVENSVRIYKNNGLGNLEASPIISSGFPRDIKFTDFDQDGHKDLIVTSYNSMNSVLFNDGEGELGTRRVVFGTKGGNYSDNNSGGLAILDANSDGFPDIFVAKGGEHGEKPNRLYINDGNGSLTDSGLRFGEDQSFDLFDADFDLDGDSDLLDGMAFRLYLNLASRSNPNNSDSDGDGLEDGEEDLNRNGIIDIGESDPLLIDTDGDGTGDAIDVNPTDSSIGGVVRNTSNSPTNAPVWAWVSVPNGTGLFRLKLNDQNFSDGFIETRDLNFSPDLVDGVYTLFVQEQLDDGSFVLTGENALTVDRTPPLVNVVSRAQSISSDNLLFTLRCQDSLADNDCSIFFSNSDSAPKSTFTNIGNEGVVEITNSQTLRFYAVDPVGNESTIDSVAAEVSADLFFQLTSRSILQDGVLNADGRLQSGSSSVSVSGLTVALDVKIPSGFVISNAMTTSTDGTGAYSFSNIQDRLRPSVGADIPSGTYTLTARFTGTSQLRASTANPQTVLVGRTAGYALIVQGRVAGGEGEAAHKKTADRVYDTLIARGFDTENIVYLGYGGDVLQNGTPSLSEIESSMNTLGSRMASSPAPFYLVLVDHGTGGLFSVSASEQLTPDLLKRYVESLESAAQVSSTSRDKERVLILGYCYSGEFIDDLAATGRVVVASAASNEESYKGVLEEDGVRSGEYFLEELFNELGRERDLRSAFIEATIKTERFTQRNQAAETRPPFFDAALQHPLLEDSADDGVLGSNLLTEGFGDGILASTLFLGVEGDTNAVPLAFTSIAPTRYLAGVASTLATTDLYAKVNDNNQVRSSVRLELRSPTQTLSEPDAARGASEQKEISNAASQIRTVLSTTADADGTLRWNVNPEDAVQLSFTDRGRYEVYYHVLDKQTPAQAAPVEVGVVYKTYDGNQPPAAFNLVEPASGVSVRTEDIFIWRETTDPDDLNNVLNVSYNLVISVDQSFANDPRFQSIDPARGQFFIAEGIQFGTYAVGREAGLVDGQSYFWKVEAVDGFGSIKTSEVRSFTVDNRNALAGPDLLVRQVVSNQRGFTGVGIPLTFEVTNLSVVADKVATHVELTSRISDNFTVSDLSPVCTESSRLIRCQLSDIGSQETELLVARLTPSREGQGTVKTIVTGYLDAARTQRQPDENLANNVSTTQFIIGAGLDSDGDGLPDIYEQENGLNPGVNDAGNDNDGDGRTNLEEFQQGTNPNQADTATTQTKKLDASMTLSLQVVNQPLLSPTGASLSVPANATAVSLNVTVVSPSDNGFITVYPCGVTRPNASNVNYVAGQVVPNGVIAPVGANGKVCFYSNSETDLIVDIAGYFVGLSFTGATPQRLIDSRDGSNNPQVSPANPIVLNIANLASQTSAGASTTVPADVKAAALNVTVVNPLEAGFVTVYPCDAPRPNASNVNYTKGQTVANGVIAPVSADGQVCVYTNQPTDVIVDLAGWFRGDEFKGATPKRLVDTRDGTGGSQGQLGASGQYGVLVVGQTLTVDGVGQQIPSSATAVALNVTVTKPQGAGFITVYPCSAERPNASNLNYVAGDTVANNVIAPIGSNGFVCVYTQSTTDVIVDVSGWFEGTSTNGFIATNPARLVDTRDGTGPAPQ